VPPGYNRAQPDGYFTYRCPRVELAEVNRRAWLADNRACDLAARIFQAKHAADHAGLTQILLAWAPAHMRDQNLECARDEVECGQGRSDLLAGISEIADHSDNRSDIHRV